MNLSDPKVQAVIVRFLLILAVTDLPIIAAQLSQPVFDWRLLLAGLLTGACAAIEKSLSPQLASVILPNAQVLAPKPENPPVVLTPTTPTPPA